MSEFEKAWLIVAGCAASIRCGVTMTRDDEFYAEVLYRHCKEYARCYEGREAGHGE